MVIILPRVKISKQQFWNWPRSFETRKWLCCRVFAYNKLVAKYGQEKVNWVSKYSSYAFPDKSYDDSKHYDISYFDKEKEYYVEEK